MTLFWAHFIIIFRSYQWTYFYIDESSCILDIWRAPSSVQLIFHILPMTNNVPWPPSHILDLFWHCLAHLCWVTPIFQLASAFENWKELLKTKYFAHNLSCVPLVSYLSLLDDRSLFKNLSRGAQTRPCVTRPSRRPISHLTHFTHRKYSKSIQYLPPRLSHCQYLWIL